MCSLHFNDSDFICESKRSQDLVKDIKRRYLKPDVVSLWPTFTIYLSTPKASSRPTQCEWWCSSAHQHFEDPRLSDQIFAPQGNSLQGVSLQSQTGPQIDPQSIEHYKPGEDQCEIG
ncbi:unnamed protein product [Lepeophtheirus salmonis]|uniref:(salmon louse) hypothetical protein n=1 Tax=Lepeophtheirus salmonis TaxID=72036 RepID=A0A7R8CXY5_LEPSM|nr:unnamed protein product [Lepeophtheirus salmonis]CAF2965721.1 unnamed protein product [Lepeophtheirus salmonis]